MSLKLKSYQVDTIKKILEHKRKKLIIAMDTGTGKTIVALTLVKLLEPTMKKILIVVPPILIANAWLYDNKRFFGIVIEPIKTSKDIHKIHDRKFKTIIISYNLMRMNIDTIKRVKWDMIIYDEAHKLGNRQSKTTKSVIGRYYYGEFRNSLTADRVYLFTGTLIPNREEQIYSQLVAVGYTSSWTKFKEKFFKTPNPMLPYFIKFKPYMRDEFNRLISKYTIVVDKQDTELNEIGKEFNYIEFPMPERLKKIQDKLKNDRVYEYDKETVITIDYNIQTFVYFRELASGFLKIDNRILDLSKLRIEIFDEFITGRANIEPYIVWYAFNFERDKIIEVLGKRNIKYWEVSGRLSSKVKEKNINEFKQSDKGVLLIQYNTGKLGLTFTNCNKMVYYSLIDDNEVFIQSQDRIHRIGQKNNCHYYIFKMSGSIDDAIIKSLKNKSNMIDTLKEWVKNG